MQLKWLEDFVALAKTQSFTLAAEWRHVTQPAFGRRIKALEAWAGTALVKRDTLPIALTAAGQQLLESSHALLQSVIQSREDLLSTAGKCTQLVSIATGRTLARTWVADWLIRMRPTLLDRRGELHIHTRSLADTARMLANSEVDFMLAYHHAALLPLQLTARQFLFATMAQDFLVPVSRADSRGLPEFHFEGATPVPYLGYAPALALGRLVDDHLANHPAAPKLTKIVECDSADALLEYTLQGVGVAWLPLSLAATVIQEKRLCTIGDSQLTIEMDVRLYRAKRTLGPLAEAIWSLAK